MWCFFVWEQACRPVIRNDARGIGVRTPSSAGFRTGGPATAVEMPGLPFCRRGRTRMLGPKLNGRAPCDVAWAGVWASGARATGHGGTARTPRLVPDHGRRANRRLDWLRTRPRPQPARGPAPDDHRRAGTHGTRTALPACRAARQRPRRSGPRLAAAKGWQAHRRAISTMCVIRSPGFAQQMDTIQDFPDNANSARRAGPARRETGSITQPRTPETHTINQDMCCFVRCNRMQ